MSVTADWAELAVREKAEEFGEDQDEVKGELAKRWIKEYAIKYYEKIKQKGYEEGKMADKEEYKNRKKDEERMRRIDANGYLRGFYYD